MENCDACPSDDTEEAEKVDLELAILEIETTQQQNSRSQADKTYHLLISFQEGERPSKKDLKDIEREFAKALGFQDHQRVVAAHDNTKNFHLHVAINKVHPTGLQNITPSWDHYKLRDCCRQIEKKYNLAINPEKTQTLSPKAADYEAHTYQQSFERYCREHKDDILGFADKSKNWQDFHQHLDKLDLRVKPRGNGLVFACRDNTIKASVVDRSLSKVSLEARWGKYTRQKKAVIRPVHDPKAKTYRPRPLVFDHLTKPLWKRFTLQQKQVGHTLLSNWKSFLITYMLTDDALAATIIATQKAAIGTLLPSYRNTYVPKPQQQAVQKPRKSTSKGLHAKA